MLKGLRTLPLRLERSSETTKAVIAWLKKHPKVDYVLYPLDKDAEQYDLACQQMRGAGGLFSVNFKTDSIHKMEQFSDALAHTFLMAVSWGAYESLQIPTCVFYGEDPANNPPLPFTFARYYIGLEDADYIIQQFEKALEIL